MCIYWLKSQASLEAEISLVRITLTAFKLCLKDPSQYSCEGVVREL
jgi:hypothetical protein